MSNQYHSAQWLKELLSETIDIVHHLKGNENLYLAEPITVRLSPHDFDLFEVHALSVSPRNELYVMDAKQEWFRLDVADMRAEKMINSIYQRVKLIYGNAVNCPVP